jgi:hypothetical protein
MWISALFIFIYSQLSKLTRFSFMPLQPRLIISFSSSFRHGFDSNIVFMDIMITTIFCSPTYTSLCPLPLEFSFSHKQLTTVRAVLRFAFLPGLSHAVDPA